MLSNHPVFERISGAILHKKNACAANQLIGSTRDFAARLASLPSPQLRERCDQVRKLVKEETPDSPRAQVEAFGVATEAFRRAIGVRLFDVQLLAASALARGEIAEMQTGEGKTFACGPAAYLHALTGRGVHVATPNSYLAKRDFELMLPGYRLLGISAGLLPEGNAPQVDKRQAYQCDITYGTGYEFGFDYLRDQLAMESASHKTLGEKTLECLASGAFGNGSLVQRGHYFSIIDEADHVLLDDAVSPLILSGAGTGAAIDADVHLAARALVETLVAGEHFTVSTVSGQIELTDKGVDWIHRDGQRIPVEQLQRTWLEYVEQALRAVALRRDVHYIVSEDGEVQIVDMGTGRIFTDRTWREGLHQAVEAKEEVSITPEKTSLAQITRQRFSRIYERLSGMTGTGVGCEREFRQVYGLTVTPIPLRAPSRRKLLPTRYFVDQTTKWNAIASSVQEMHESQRPLLVGSNSIADSEILAAMLRNRGVEYRLLNGRQDEDEAHVIARAGRRGAVTIATSLAGRGTDIKLESDVNELGGLHVIVSECSDSARIDRQLIGRCARQGDAGSAQMFVSSEDALVQQYGSWLAHSIQRHANSDGEAHVVLDRQLLRIQRSAERASYSARCAMLRRDLSRDSLLSSQTLDS